MRGGYRVVLEPNRKKEVKRKPLYQASQQPVMCLERKVKSFDSRWRRLQAEISRGEMKII